MWSLSGSTIDEKFYFDIFKRHFTQNDIKKLAQISQIYRSKSDFKNLFLSITTLLVFMNFNRLIRISRSVLNLITKKVISID